MIGELIRDKTYPTMWRVVMQDGNLSDMINKQRASELSRLLMLEERNSRWAKGKVA